MSGAFSVVIPSRMAATRLPGKPLLDLGGKPLIVRCLENAMAAGAAEVVVATDDERIASAVKAAGGDAHMTRADHTSGTDRIAQVAAERGWDPATVVVNLQGDEPLVPGDILADLANALHQRPEFAMATAATPILDTAELFSPDAVKVVLADDGRALYFSRAPIPYVRDAWRGLPPGEHPTALPDGVTHLRHLGLYAYRVSTLASVSAAPAAIIERAESLEQLRLLSMGLPIHVTVLPEAPPPGVDTPADLERVRARWERPGGD